MATFAHRNRRSGRRSPLTSAALLLIGLLATGGAYAAFTATSSADAASQTQVTKLTEEGEKLFAANCASCHGLQAEGTEDAPTLIGVGAASVDFQVGTGRMPMAASGPQAEQKPVQFTEEQIAALATWVASLGPGPAIPDERYLQGDGDLAVGAELFRINCAMCHNVAGAGGALTQGKFAPGVVGVSAKHVYEAMITGPQNMPVFNDANISPEDKSAIITYLQYLETSTSPGGLELGSLGPVSEGLFIWIFALGGIVAITVWLTAKSN
ncbi:cytochrome bc1 complex diheme cytochrome c subunit [Homoserinibacter gongjuensis]|jgi:ubiquinol-cytochrome c reductase cytochrome c subunit|uniref:Cytochrome bc1 complex cytochrome c subunit n=1 Tax=Homoserinibacter gongjuensis TaxID=1162968 RepID=A0ABQ6JXH1_9MICO|nr:c-type cytochrome [Homoserinibacter gongjuensis]GMA92714.1 cystathionine beta-lyase [Homoserinibacter gongjuensis]